MGKAPEPHIRCSCGGRRAGRRAAGSAFPRAWLRGTSLTRVLIAHLCCHINFIDISPRSLEGKETPAKPGDVFIPKPSKRLMLRNIWNYRLKGGMCLVPVWADRNQPSPCCHKHRSAGLADASREQGSSLRPTPGWPERVRTGFLCPVGLELSASLEAVILRSQAWVLGLILKPPVLSTFCTRRNRKREEMGLPRPPRCTEIGFGALLSKAATWPAVEKLRCFHREKPGEKFSAFHFYHSREVSHTDATAFKTWSFSW